MKSLCVLGSLLTCLCGHLLFYHFQLTNPLLNKAWSSAFFVAMCAIVSYFDRLGDEENRELERPLQDATGKPLRSNRIFKIGNRYYYLR